MAIKEENEITVRVICSDEELKRILKEKGLVALLGTSGSGKTTLLNTIGGLDKVNRGKI